MILASIDWLTISINLLLILFVITAVLMSLLILMQRPKQEGLGAAFGSGMTDQMFGARTTNVLQKGTVDLGSLFFILPLTLAILFARKNERGNAGSMVEDLPAEEEVVTPEETPVEEPEDTPSLEESLEGQLDPAESTEESTEPAEESTEPAEETTEAPESGEPTEPAAEEAPAEEPAAEEAPSEEAAAEEPASGETPAGGDTPSGESNEQP